MRAHLVIVLSGLALLSFACKDSPRPSVVGTFNMGERAGVGPLVYTVFDTKWAISLGEAPTQRVPNNRFFIINLSVVNSGSDPSNIPTFTLVDDDGQTYQELDNGVDVPNWLGIVRRVRPADSAQGTIIFDVPQKRFKLRVANEADDFAFVTIPLSFGDTTLGVTPGGAR